MEDNMSNFEKQARKVIEKHGCTFIRMCGECKVVWQNKQGYQFVDDIFVLNHMTERAWKFWENYTDN